MKRLIVLVKRLIYRMFLLPICIALAHFFYQQTRAAIDRDCWYDACVSGQLALLFLAYFALTLAIIVETPFKIAVVWKKWRSTRKVCQHD